HAMGGHVRTAARPRHDDVVGFRMGAVAARAARIRAAAERRRLHLRQRDRSRALCGRVEAVSRGEFLAAVGAKYGHEARTARQPLDRAGDRRTRGSGASENGRDDGRRRRVRRRLPVRVPPRGRAARLPPRRQLRWRPVDARRRRCRVAAAQPPCGSGRSGGPGRSGESDGNNASDASSIHPRHPTYPAYRAYSTHPTIGMKIAVMGGGGVRPPLLVSGLAASDLPIDEIALYDIDQTRLSIIGGVAERMAGSGRWRGRVTCCRSFAEAVAWADFVFTSIRVGGNERRVRDEATAQWHGIVGQETVGPAGFAMAARTIPPMVRYAREIADAAPRAWIINFTNPVGMVTEAMRTASERVVGICDTPTELFAATANALG